MALKWFYQFCLLLWLYFHAVCGRELQYKGKEWERVSRLTDPPINNSKFEGYHKERTSHKQHHSSGLAHDNSFASSASLSEYIRHWANYETVYGQYYGTRAKINLWAHPDLKPSQTSSTVLWVLNFDGAANVIEVGFHADGYKSTGCYNFRCEGFVMDNWNILTPGDIVDNVSTYNGQQYYITLSIKKDPHTRNWLLCREDLGVPQLIGYWPRSLFTTLADSATLVRWGGFVSYLKKEIGSPMGSGHYPSELEQKAAYIKNIELFNSEGKSFNLIDGAQSAYTDAKKCYKVSALVNSNKYGLHDGYMFYFGGPSGCTK